MTEARNKPEWEAEVQLSPAEAAEIVSTSYAEFRSSHVTAYAEGWDNAAFLFDDRVLFRFPRRSLAVDLLEREVELLPRIASDLPLPISAPQYSGRWRGELHWPFAGYRFIPGTPASLQDLDDERRSLLIEPLAIFLKRLHAIPPKPLLEAGLLPDPFARFDVDRWALKALRRATSIKQHGLAVPATLLKWFESTAPSIGDFRTLVHGDLYARHVLLDAGGAPCGIIDWGDMHLGTPAIDLSVAHTMLPPAVHETFRSHYGPVEEDVWEAARWRAIYAALLFLDYGIEADVPDMRSCGAAALALMAQVEDL